jgi:hypothetical protein
MTISVTIDDLSAGVFDRLQTEAQRRGVDVKMVVKEFIEKGLGPLSEPDPAQMHHELDALAGTWSKEEAAGFFSAIADTRQCEEDLWK